MRGTFVDQGGLFSYIAPEARVPAKQSFYIWLGKADTPAGRATLTRNL